jgi:hypothetical protein
MCLSIDLFPNNNNENNLENNRFTIHQLYIRKEVEKERQALKLQRYSHPITYTKIIETNCVYYFLSSKKVRNEYLEKHIPS